MKRLFGTTQSFVIVGFPIVAASVLAALPSRAATLAVSAGEANFYNFNRAPESTVTDTNTTAIVTSLGGNAASFADATALFQVNPPIAANTSLSQALGRGDNYIGLANSQATILGRFLVTDGLQFDFQTHLVLNVAVDDRTAENAKASGELVVSIFNSTDPSQLSLLDFLTIEGNLDTANSLNAPQGQASRNFIFAASLLLNTALAGSQQSAEATLSGSYQRKFAQPTYITLVESKENRVTVQTVPEPSGLCLGSGALIAYWVRRQVGKKMGLKKCSDRLANPLT